MKEVFSIGIIGTVESDTELKKTKNDKSYVRFTVTVTNKYTDKNTKEEKSSKEYFNITAWGKEAEEICSLEPRGKQIKIKARRSPNEYKNKDGVSVKDWNINLQEYEIISGASETPQTPKVATAEVKKTEVAAEDNLPF